MILILTNLQAGKNRLGKYKKHGLDEVIEGYGKCVHTETTADLEDTIGRNIEKGNVDLILINGGDGTIHQTITWLLNREGERNIPPIFPLRGGTMNVLASNMGLKGNPTKLSKMSVDSFLMSSRSGEVPTKKIRSLELSIDDGNSTLRQFGFMFGNGALYRYDKEYYSNTKGGPLAAAPLVARCLTSAFVKKGKYKEVFVPVPMRVEINGERHPSEKFIIVLAMVFSKLVLSFSPFSECGEGDFNFLAAVPTVREMSTKLHRLFWTKGGEPPLPYEKYVNGRANELKIFSREGFTFDGDVYDMSREHMITVKAGPYIEIFTPEFTSLNFL